MVRAAHEKKLETKKSIEKKSKKESELKFEQLAHKVIFYALQDGILGL